MNIYFILFHFGIFGILFHFISFWNFYSIYFILGILEFREFSGFWQLRAPAPPFSFESVKMRSAFSTQALTKRNIPLSKPV